MTTESQADRRHRGPSIITRLTLLFSLSALITLGTATFLLHRAFIADLEKDDLSLLQDKVYWLRIALRNNSDFRDLLLQEVVADAEARTRGPAMLFYTRVLDGTGHVIVETPGMSERLPQDIFPAPMPMHRMQDQMQHWTSPTGRVYQMVAVLEPHTKGAMPARVYQVGLDDTLEETLLARYRRTSLLLVALGTTVFAAAGYLIARSALRPLRNIASTAEQITATRLHERLRTREWPTELVPVAESFDRMLTRLEESFGRLTECSAELAHELRTPIQNLMGQTEVALSRDRSPEDYREVLQSNVEELDRLARMLNGLMFLARADDPRTQIERMPLDARRELEGVRDFYEALADALQVVIACEGHAQVFADPSLFRRRRHEPRIQRAASYTARGHRHALRRGAGRCRDRHGARQRQRHRAGTPAPGLRAFLPHRAPGPRPVRRRRTRAAHREIDHGPARRHGQRRKHARSRHDGHAAVSATSQHALARGRRITGTARRSRRGCDVMTRNPGFAAGTRPAQGRTGHPIALPGQGRSRAAEDGGSKGGRAINPGG